ncbi:hypothetical protein [Teredinibacter sp. KSP-S5-2]|uniref:hypothetical protein n=1 Tax=Teredinibacter sp. KSP-S5-2 TaxID=3034506 RepID=UPI0029344408|nr:hypothetical protein [Teredinibacter sp. KSP-S5-2]WNO09099.1 hypothetical protein P5V12_19330 [Teredinibacter sp. KSP-S5-2]
MRIYTAFGLYIESDIELPPLAMCYQAKADIVIRLAAVSYSGLLTPVVVKPFSQTAPNELWFHVPGIAWFYVFNGNTVHIMPEENADMQSIRLYVLGTCMGAIMHQRNRLILHGNAIRVGNECIVFAGNSGNGKSTLATAFYKRGYQILSDDLAVLDDSFKVQPTYPQIKIWQDTANKFDIDTQALTRIRYHVEKFALPLNTDGFCDTPLPVKRIYILKTHNKDTVDLETIRGMDKFMPLKAQTYRYGHLEGLGLKPQHLKICSELANKVELKRITRPKQKFCVDALVNIIEKDLEQEKCVA